MTMGLDKPFPALVPFSRKGKLLRVRENWAERWSDALALWSRFTKLSEPRWCFDAEDEVEEHLSGSFAMIRLEDQGVVISLSQVLDLGLEDYALEILGHEIGHHVYCPADLTDHARLLARIRKGLPTKEHLAPFVANLYTDLLINDRLRRHARLKMPEVYRLTGRGSQDRMWTLYMRIYEVLWSLKKQDLATGFIDGTVETDALLGARLIRVYAREWLDGAGRFAALCLPYLMEDEAAQMQKLFKPWSDTENAGIDGIPVGVIEVEDEEAAGAIHPAMDERLSGLEPDEESEEKAGETRGPADQASHQGGGAGQCREPFEYGEILKSMGIQLDDHELAVRYYKERATPHLIRFPERVLPSSTEPLPEGLAVWDIGSPMEKVDWFESVIRSPRVIPGYTTVQRTYGVTRGSEPDREPVDLDLYVDSSGSMPNPQVATSYLTLAGAIVALSALRVGSRVQATLWSGKNQFTLTDGFVRDEKSVLRVLTGYFGGATAFPIHVLRDTYAGRQATDRKVHILVISDDGVTTMFDHDERRTSGWQISRMALEKAGGGGTMVLNLWRDWRENPELERAGKEGWHIHRVQSWEDLEAFAREFSKLHYEVRGDEDRR